MRRGHQPSAQHDSAGLDGGKELVNADIVSKQNKALTGAFHLFSSYRRHTRFASFQHLSIQLQKEKADDVETNKLTSGEVFIFSLAGLVSSR